MTNVAAVVLFLGVVLYAVFGGADFGAGFWDLTAGGPERGRSLRALIDHALGPVWEANHTWLIYCLVVLWTAFPSAFAALMGTLYLPFGLAALGIVLRGSGFAFRKVSVRTREQRASGAAFASSSIVTPFFFGTIAGAVASGRVPSDGAGNAFTSWLNPTSLLGGVLAVLVCAYLAAVFLVAEARHRSDAGLERAFRLRALVAAGAAGVVALAGIGILHADSPRLFDQLLGPGLPFVLLSGVSGAAALLLLGRARPRFLRLLAVVAVGSIVVGWGVAQYPYVLGTHLTLNEAAAPQPTLISVAVVFGAAAVLVVPSLVLLYALQQRGRLESA